MVGCWRKRLLVAGRWWSRHRQRAKGCLCASYQDVSAQCVFDFGDDVSPSDLKAVAEKVEYDAPVGGRACTGFMCFA